MARDEARYVTIRTADGQETTFLLYDDQISSMYRDWENRAYTLLKVSGCLTGDSDAVHKIVKAHVIAFVESDRLN